MKVGFVSLGCPKNLVDSEVMMGLLAARGHELTPNPQDADVLVVNTCSFIDPAKQESIDAILEMAEYKKTGRAKRLIVAGCLVERYRGDIRKDLPEVDAIAGTNDLESIVALCEGDDAAPASPEPYLYHELTPRILATPRHFAYIKIAEGCDHPCSFCVIPQYRGRFRSRRFESVISEATGLFARGVREINLIGPDTTCYGEDLGIENGLALLLSRLAGIETEREKWIRFLYAYPNKVTQKLLDALAAHASLVKYIDIPLQHSSAAVLRRMKRGGSGDIFLRLIERIRRTVPGVTVRTSLIVGFPGETDAEFAATRELMEAVSFDMAYIFKYSPRPGTVAARMPDDVPQAVKEQRLARLLEDLDRRVLEHNKAAVGQTVEVLVEGPSLRNPQRWCGRTGTHKMAIFDPVPGLASGDLVRVRVDRGTAHSLFGVICA